MVQLIDNIKMSCKQVEACKHLESLLKSGKIAVFLAIRKMNGCITTGSCRPHSELVGGDDEK